MRRGPTVGGEAVPIAPDRFAPGMARQLLRLREALRGGMPRCGWKVGINVPEMRRRLGLPHPAVGWLDGRRVLATGSELRPESQARLHAEPELAIRIARAVPPEGSAETARASIGAVHPALELVDYARPGSSLDEVLEHCMFHEATVLGPAGPLEATRELGREKPTLRVGGGSAHPPRSDLVPSDPGTLVAFVASYLGVFDQSLEAGDLVLSGSYTAQAAPLGPGEEAIADFGPLGTVSVRRAR